MTRQTIESVMAGRKAKPAKSNKRPRDKNSIGKNSAGKHNAGRAANGGRGAGTRQAQLITLLSRKGGARLSLISERLGWQAHTVRAAISGLRKQGFGIETAKAPASKNAKTSSGSGETVYAIVASPDATDTSSGGAAQ